MSADWTIILSNFGTFSNSCGLSPINWGPSFLDYHTFYRFDTISIIIKKKLWHFSELWRAFLRLIGELIGAEAGVVAAQPALPTVSILKQSAFKISFPPLSQNGQLAPHYSISQPNL